MLGSIRKDARLAAELRFWLGQNIFAARAFPDARRLARTATTALSVDVQGTP